MPLNLTSPLFPEILSAPLQSLSNCVVSCVNICIEKGTQTLRESRLERKKKRVNIFSDISMNAEDSEQSAISVKTEPTSSAASGHHNTAAIQQKHELPDDQLRLLEGTEHSHHLAKC